MIFFFYGPNSFGARQQIAKLTKQYIGKTGSDMGLERIDGARITIGELQSSLQASPFLATSRLVIVEDLGANKAVAPKIAAIATGIPNTTVAVFYDPSVDQRTTYFKDIKAIAKVVEFGELDRGKLQRWIAQTVEDHNATIERPAVGRLLERAGDDQWRLSTEISKLAEYANPITVAAVEEQVELSPTDSVFDLAEAVTAGHQSVALEIYANLRHAGNHETYILSMLIWQMRNLIMAKAAGKISAPALAKTASMSPYVASKMLAKRHLFNESALKQSFLQAVDLDYRIKTGDIDANLGVEQLIVELSQRFQAGANRRS